ncbi:hypothetical protein V5O48_013894 [Marasmius crinis-equi]|uniref:Uncharacterized protein n=1 Tax=Marasmius crinis-equi TaxID=585013 RepID=A0ABR3ESB7_9AGAR
MLPLPPSTDGTLDLGPWLREQNHYYWSLDPNGDAVMLDEQRKSLSLPSLTESLCVYHDRYPAEAYEFVQKWQEAKGFDPTTTDFACSMGFPILEILPRDDNRFENVAEVDEGDSPLGTQYEDMVVESIVDRRVSAHGSLSSPFAQSEMDVDTNTTQENMEVDE